MSPMKKAIRNPGPGGGLLRLFPGYPVEKQDHYRAVLPRQCVQGRTTAAMGLDAGQAALGTTLNCSGAYTVAKQNLPLCRPQVPMGAQNMAQALRNSCNIYFIQLGQRLGPQAFYDYFDAFGFTVAQRCGPAQRDRFYAVLHSQRAGRGAAGILLLWPGDGDDPAADVPLHFLRR